MGGSILSDHNFSSDPKVLRRLYGRNVKGQVLETSGTANSIILTSVDTDAITSLKERDIFSFIAEYDSTGQVEITIDGMDTYELEANSDIIAGRLVTVMFDYRKTILHNITLGDNYYKLVSQFSMSGFTEKLDMEKEFSVSPIIPHGTESNHPATVGQLSIPIPDKIIQMCHGMLIMLYDGKVYTCTTNSSFAGFYGSTDVNSNTGITNLSPIYFPTEKKIVDIGSNGHAISYGLDEDGALFTWGHNSWGACGLGHSTATSIPTLCLTGVEKVWASDNKSNDVNKTVTIALMTNGEYKGWGNNQNGELGLGDNSVRLTPTTLSMPAGTIESIWNYGGQSGNIVIQMDDNTIWMTGENDSGNFGGGATGTAISSWTNVTSYWISGTRGKIKKYINSSMYANTSAEITESDNVVYMLFENGDLLACGSNGWGQCGNGSNALIRTPNHVLSGVSDIVTGGGGRCTIWALTDAGELYGWGFGGYMTVVDTATNTNSTPVLIDTNVIKLFAPMPNMHYAPDVQTMYYSKQIGDSVALIPRGSNVSGVAGIGVSDDSITKVPSGYRVKIPADEVPLEMFSTYTDTIQRMAVVICESGKWYAMGYNGNKIITTDGTTDFYHPKNVRPGGMTR